MRKRSAFTIIELLVAAVMTMAIMWIIAHTLTTTLGIFRTLRSTGMMQEKLMSAQTVLKRDLSAEHFGGTFQAGYSGPYLRDQRLDLTGWIPPQEGYFSIFAGADSTIDGTDPDGLSSFMSVNHSLAFTVKLHGNRDEEMFYASAPFAGPADFPGQFASRWAEVFYFLTPNGQTANGTPLYTLTRRQRLLLPASGSQPLTAAQATNFPDIGFATTLNAVARSTDVPQRANRFPIFATAQPSGGNIWRTQKLDATDATATPGYLAYPASVLGDDILLADVISFEVKVSYSTAPNPLAGNLDWPFAVVPASTANPALFNDVNLPSRIFDTWSQADSPKINWSDNTTWIPANNPPPNRIRIQSIQFRLRIWDVNIQNARQVTMVFDV